MSMAENLRLARPYLLLLALCTVGRWLMGTFGVPYVKGHHVFSIVILTLYAAIFYGVFCRRWRRFRLWQAAGLALTIGFISQVVIFAATVLSYALGLHTYFNNPTAMLGPDGAALTEVPFSQALLTRVGGLIVNPIMTGIAGAIGWAIGGLLPEN
jgi:uncharacterized membrane protein YagU involved in acid resistance